MGAPSKGKQSQIAQHHFAATRRKSIFSKHLTWRNTTALETSAKKRQGTFKPNEGTHSARARYRNREAYVVGYVTCSAIVRRKIHQPGRCQACLFLASVLSSSQEISESYLSRVCSGVHYRSDPVQVQSTQGDPRQVYL